MVTGEVCDFRGCSLGVGMRKARVLCGVAVAVLCAWCWGPPERAAYAHAWGPEAYAQPFAPIPRIDGARPVTEAPVAQQRVLQLCELISREFIRAEFLGRKRIKHG